MNASGALIIREAAISDREAILDVWLRSVRATHAFLTEEHIQALLPEVRDLALPALELWVLCAGQGEVIGFLGLSGASIEALFLCPRHLRRGGGRMLVEHARRLKGALTVDVNEQNPEALKFYEACGFEVVGRSPVDAGGRPFPLLHLAQSIPKDRTPMFDHVVFGVSDYAASKAFFLKALEPLGVEVASEGPLGLEIIRKGGKVSLCLRRVPEKPSHLHLAFAAENRRQVEAFHRAALEAGGKDNGAPGLRPQYHANYYAAFVIGPDGHNIEVVCHEPEPRTP